MIHQTTNTRCLIKAARNLGLRVEIFDKNGNFVMVREGEKKLFFANYATPFNSASVEKICKDKEFTHLLLESVVRMPRAKGFFDPLYNEGGEIKNGRDTLASLTQKIMESFTLPLILKPNSRARGLNVALCIESRHVYDALERIFDHRSEYYDYVALAEEYVKIDKEYRVVVYDKKIALLYEKDISGAEFNGNLSPLHWDGAKAVIIEDENLKKKLAEFISPIFDKFELNFAGLDIIIGKDSKIYLLEVNTQIGFANFVKDNGEKPLIEFYEKIFKPTLYE